MRIKNINLLFFIFINFHLSPLILSGEFLENNKDNLDLVEKLDLTVNLLRGDGVYHKLSDAEKFYQALDIVMDVRKNKLKIKECDIYFSFEFSAYILLKNYLKKSFEHDHDIYRNKTQHLENAFDLINLISEQATCTLKYVNNISNCKSDDYVDFINIVKQDLRFLININNINQIMELDTNSIIRKTYSFEYFCVYKIVNLMSSVSSLQNLFSEHPHHIPEK